MNDDASRALLPNGLSDMLPPDAAFEADVITRLMSCFARQGYERVKPPLIEFEESLLGGDSSMAAQTFRVMDPLSQRMMGVRADMTIQVGRIATSRLAKMPRPLRLCYSGQVLRVKGTQLRPERQFAQAGIELIGASSVAAEVEVILNTVDALRELGLDDVSVDLTLTTLVPALFDDLGLTLEKSGPLFEALDHKDAASITRLGGAAADTLMTLLSAVGAGGRGLKILRSLSLPSAAAAERDRLVAVMELIQRDAPDLMVTVDPLEHRGHSYYSGVSFSLFSSRVGGEVGRGGRYPAGGDEPATGATLFMDTVLAALPHPEEKSRLFLPVGVSRDEARSLRAQGWITIVGLEDVPDERSEAVRLGCTHIWRSQTVTPL